MFCRIHLAHYRLCQYLRHAHKKVPLICEKHLPTKYSGYATARHTDSVRSIVYVLLSVRERQAFWICVKVIQAVVDVLDICEMHAGSGRCVRYM